jgi:signal peptidase II
MKAKGFIRTLVIFIILCSNIGCDQVSKSMVRNQLDRNEQISLISKYVTLTNVENPGAFLSLGGTLPKPVRLLLLTILPLLVLGLSLIYLLTKRNLSHLNILGICFLLGGGIGNIYDRAVYGSVTDFLHIDFVVFQTGIFNLADVSIMSGVAMILIGSYFKEDKLTYQAIDNHPEL